MSSNLFLANLLSEPLLLPECRRDGMLLRSHLQV